MKEELPKIKIKCEYCGCEWKGQINDICPHCYQYSGVKDYENK